MKKYSEIGGLKKKTGEVVIVTGKKIQCIPIGVEVEENNNKNPKQQDY